MRKILQILPSFNKSWGGPRKTGAELSNYISTNKFGLVDICCTNVYGDYSILEKNNEINIHQFDVSVFNKVWITHTNSFSDFLKEKICEYDILHIHEMWHYLHYLSAKISIKNKIPYIITPHGGLEKRRLNNIKKYIFAHLIEKKICDNAKYIHSLTKFENQDILSLSPNAKTIIIPNGVNIKPSFQNSCDIYSKYNIDQRAKKILFLGRLHKDKGLDLLINSFKKESINNNWNLIIAGPDQGNYEEVYKNNKNIIFTGLVEGVEKLNLLNIVDVFILPSYGEGFSISVLEAMSFKIPVIISKYCYFPEVEEFNTGIIIDLNQESIGNALNKILMNQSLQYKMGNNGFDLVKKKYENKFIYSQIMKLYN